MTSRPNGGRRRTPLWLSDLGAVSCAQHLPSTAAQTLERRPGAQQLTADAITWHRLSSTDLESLRAMSKHECSCEGCATTGGTGTD